MNTTFGYRQSKRDALAAFFRNQPNVWVDGTVLETIGGRYAWRTRVSDLQKQLGMSIENRLVKNSNIAISEYRYVPA